MWSMIIPVEAVDEITPSDSEFLAKPIRAIYVGTSGDVALVDIEGSTRVLPNLAAGMWHPQRAIKILATDTTATDILGGR